MTHLKQKTKNKIEHGDIKKTADHSKITTNTIGEAIRTGGGSRKTVQAIEDYFEHIETLRNEKLQKNSKAG